MREVIQYIKTWDDLERHRDPKAKVEASATAELAVRITDPDGKVLEGGDVVLDLTSDHAAELWHKVRQYVEAGQPRSTRREPDGARYPSGRRKNSVAPLEKLCPFAPGTEGRRSWLADLRAWAEAEGRLADLHRPGWVPGKSQRADSDYHYTKPVIEAYIASPAYPDWHVQKKAS